MEKKNTCSLCGDKLMKFAEVRKRKYNRCLNCFSIQLDNDFLLNQNVEKKRYELHNNDVEDPNYQNFVKPIVDYILSNHKVFEKGLDFGAGTGPVIAKLLTKQNYQVALYDPYFWDNPDLFDDKYDYIIACEVIEHFHNPHKEFELLSNLLNKNSSLVIMTVVYQEEIDFNNWYYKNDETHVFFYTKETLEYIKEAYGFKELIIKDRLIVFKN